MEGKLIHLVSAICFFSISVGGMPTSIANESIDGRRFGFARVVGEGLHEFSTLASFEMWGITTYCSGPRERSYSAADFQSELKIQVEILDSQLVYETENMLQSGRWSIPKRVGRSITRPQQAWVWDDVEVTLENAMQLSQSGPGGPMDWLRVELSVVPSEPQLPSKEPLWKFYHTISRWSVGIGAVSGDLLHNPLIPPTQDLAQNTTFSSTLEGHQTDMFEDKTA